MSKVNQYEALVATVESGTLAKAAQTLNCSPSAISKQLTALENELGVTLLERSSRKVEVTDTGHQFYKRCKEILANIRQAEEEALTHRDEEAGKIVLSLTTVLTRSPLMAAIAEFSVRYPNIRFDLNMNDSFEDLVTERIDFAFRLGKLADNRLRAIPLFDTKPIFCASPAYIERHGKPAKLVDLQSHQVGILSTLNLGSLLGKMSEGKISSPLPLDDYHMSNDINTLYTMIKNGICVGGLLDINVAEDLASGELIQLFPQKQFPGKKLYLVYAKQGVLPKKLRLFKEFIKNRLSVSALGKL